MTCEANVGDEYSGTFSIVNNTHGLSTKHGLISFYQAPRETAIYRNDKKQAVQYGIGMAALRRSGSMTVNDVKSDSSRAVNGPQGTRVVAHEFAIEHYRGECRGEGAGDFTAPPSATQVCDAPARQCLHQWMHLKK